MLARCKIAYSAGEVARKLSREQWENLRKRVWGLKLPEWEEGKNEPPNWYSYGEDTILDITTDAVPLADAGILYEIKEFKNTYKTEGKDSDGTIHNINIALPNIGLLSINEVTWLEDACTEALQNELDKGWRILAVCPPNGTRRPTYIIGRTT